MSESSTSRVDPRVLLAAGWRPEELAWESLMEKGDAESVLEALRLARATFERDDPRLATSLIARGVTLEAEGDPAAAALFTEAAEIWRAAKDWTARLKPERRSRSATYHLRLERRYAGQYDRFSEERYAELYEQGRAAAEAHVAGEAVEDARGQWGRERPQGFNDRRRLLAAVCFMPPRR
jgi:hypothetical protein